MLPLPHKHISRRTECCACHDFGNGISKVPRLPQFRTPPAERATPSCPFKQLPNAAPAPQTHTRMHRLLRLPCHTNTPPDAQNAAPATTSATASPKCYACHDFAHAPPRARQHPVPLDSCRMLPLPHKHTPKCTECCAYHDFGNGIAKVLRLLRFRSPPAARAPTSCPSRQLPNATPATQTHPDAQNATPATTSATASPKCCACYDFAHPSPRARQHPVPLDSCRMLPLPHKHTPRCTECCACHDFGNGIAKVLRLPRFRTPNILSL